MPSGRATGRRGWRGWSPGRAATAGRSPPVEHFAPQRAGIEPVQVGSTSSRPYSRRSEASRQNASARTCASGRPSASSGAASASASSSGWAHGGPSTATRTVAGHGGQPVAPACRHVGGRRGRYSGSELRLDLVEAGVRQCGPVGEHQGRDGLVAVVHAHDQLGGRVVALDVDLVESRCPRGRAGPSAGRRSRTRRSCTWSSCGVVVDHVMWSNLPVVDTIPGRVGRRWQDRDVTDADGGRARAGRARPRAARCRRGGPRAGVHPGRRGHGQDPGDHAPHRLPGAHRRGPARPAAGRHLHRPRRRRAAHPAAQSRRAAACRPAPSTPRRCASCSTSRRACSAARCPTSSTTRCGSSATRGPAAAARRPRRGARPRRRDRLGQGRARHARHLSRAGTRGRPRRPDDPRHRRRASTPSTSRPSAGPASSTSPTC